MFRNAIAYRGQWAMPGSQLHKFLSEGKQKEAAASFADTVERERVLMQRIDKQFPSIKEEVCEPSSQ